MRSIQHSQSVRKKLCTSLVGTIALSLAVVDVVPFAAHPSPDPPPYPFVANLNLNVFMYHSVTDCL